MSEFSCIDIEKRNAIALIHEDSIYLFGFFSAFISVAFSNSAPVSIYTVKLYRKEHSVYGKIESERKMHSHIKRNVNQC